MPKLELRLFGGIEIHVQGKMLEGLVSRKADALVAYLACNPSLHARERLADLLWDNRNAATAMGNLRVLLNSIRNELSPPVIITRNSVHLEQTEDVWVDVELFERLNKPLTHLSNRSAALPSELVDNLHRALTLYQGEFLAGFHLREAQQFEDWVMLERERYHVAAVNMAHALVSHYISSRQYTLGVTTAQRWLQFDFFNEYAHRLLMELLVHQDQLSAALDHYQRYADRLSNEGMEPSSAIIALYQQISRDALNAQAELLQSELYANSPTTGVSTLSPTTNTVPHNLPSALTPLIGRETELALLQERLQDPHCRLLTIVGLGGVGKTHLAIEAARQLAKEETTPTQFRDGIYLIRFDRLEPDQLLPSLIASAINFTFQGVLDQQAQLFQYLRGRHMLLIFDNFEHLLHYADFLDILLQHAPRLKVLVTSRERLEFMGEWLLPVEGLPCAPDTSEMDREEKQDRLPDLLQTQPALWHDYPAPQLFIHTARALRPNFTAAQQKSAIIQICRTLEGLPLGIQLAAAAVHVHECDEIATALVSNLDFLNTKMRNLPERHKSLRAIFLHSWQLLTDKEREAFRALAVFVDGFSAAIAERVANIAPETLTQLRDKSLIQQIEIQRQSAPNQQQRRYRLHPVLHHYATEQLDQAADHRAELYHQHCLYFCNFVAAQEDAFNRKDAGAAADNIALELENIRASWRHAANHGLIDLLRKMLPALIRFYLLRGFLQDALTLLASTADEVTSWLNDPAVDPLQPTLDTMKISEVERQHTRHLLLAYLQIYSAEVYTELGEYEKAARAAQTAIQEAQLSKDSITEALGNLHWGIALNYLGDYRLAKEKLQQTLNRAHEENLRAIEGAAQRHMGVNSFYQGDYTGGRLQHESAIKYYQESGNLSQELRTYHSLAMLYFYTGDYLQARRHYERCLEMYQEIGDRPTMALTLNNLGAVSTQLGDYTNAHRSFEEALAIRQRIGDRQMEGLILANLGLLMHLMNNHRQSVDYGLRALEVSLETGEHDTEAYARSCLAHAQLELGQMQDAVANYELAVSMRKSAGQHTQMLEPLAGLARVYLRMREPEQALHYVEKILQHLEPETNEGIVELVRIYLTCYRVLYQTRDKRAEAILTTGHSILQERANRIVDKTLRQLYLDNVIAHRELLTEYETQRPLDLGRG